LHNINLINSKDIRVFKETPFTQRSVRIPANFTGKHFVTIIALNNAYEPSEAVCSDGITRDLSPPEIRNLTLQNGAWSETIACSGKDVFLLDTYLRKVKLQRSASCQKLCSLESSSADIVDLIPINPKNNSDEVSQFYCKTFPVYKNNTIIYLPNDHLYIQWDVVETGSQVDDFYVGIGWDSTEYDSPTIPYVSTNKKTHFKKRHDAIGSNELFYAFLKVVNKAGKENIYSFGPLLIDETPPLHNSLPRVVLENESIVFGWQNTTFYDEEQTEPIDQIFFQIG